MLKITNIGHACILFETEDFCFVVDPYKPDSVPGLDMPRLTVDKALASHDHHDHNGVNFLNYTGKIVDIDYKTILVPHDHHNGTHRGTNNAFIFNIDGYRIIHTGDLGCIPSEDVLNKMKNADILLAPINGHFTISAEELVKLVRLINPKLVIPMHYEIKEKGIGYPDGGQIDKFKALIGDYKEVEEDYVIVDKKLFDKPALIFNKARGERK